MKKRFTTLFFLLIFALNVNAQNPGPMVKWQQCFGTSNYDQINSIKAIKNGKNYVATAFFTAKDNFLSNEIDSGYYFLVFDENFNLIKKMNIPVFAFHILEKPNGKLILGGITMRFWDKYNIIQNEPDDDIYGTDFAFIEIDSTLTNITWARAYGSTGMETYLIDMALLDDNSILFTGTTRGANGDIPDNSPCFNPFNENAVLFKIDSLGNKQWVKVFGGSGGEIPVGKIIKYNDNLFRIDFKSSSDNCDYTGTEPFSNTGIFKTQLILIDANGNILKRKIDDDGKDLTWKAGGWRRNGKVYMFGSASAQTALHPTYPLHDGLEFGIAIYDDSLNLLDMKVWGGKGRDFLTNYVQQSANEYYFWGKTTSSDGLGDVKNYKGGTADYWLMKTDSNFNILWSKTIGSAGMDADLDEKFPTDAMIIRGSELIIVDNIYPPQLLPQGDVSCGLYNVVFPGAQVADGWMIAFDLSTGIEQEELNSTCSFQLFPNPAESTINIETSLDIRKYIITNTQGKILLELKEPNARSINISSLSKGVYLLKAIGKNNEEYVEKFVLK